MCGVNLGWRMRVSALPPLLVSGVIYRNASCSRRALRERSGLICVGGRVSQAAGAQRGKHNAVIWVINIIVSAHFKPVKTTLVPRKPSWDLQRGGFEASREGKWSCQAIRDPSQSSTKETVSPLLSLHRSNYCSSAGVAFRFSVRAAPRASCIHARREWMRGDRREKS